MKCTGNRILVKEDVVKVEEKKINGIIMPLAVSTPNTNTGTVTLVGPGMFDKGDYMPMHCQVGDRVVYPKGAGFTFKIDDEEHKALYDSEVIVIL
jgi:co-chaperonin GroES (HSP10)